MSTDEMLKMCAAFTPLSKGNKVMRCFAPPYVELPDGRIICQTANIIYYVACKGGLTPEDEVLRAQMMAILMTVIDVCDEVHGIHHPISRKMHYEEQKNLAIQKAKPFVKERLPQYFAFLEETIEVNGGKYLLGDTCTAADVVVLQLALGQEFAYPKTFAKISKSNLKLLRLVELVKARPRLAEYLKSERRVPFNTNGIFRNYPELDLNEGADDAEAAAEAGGAKPVESETAGDNFGGTTGGEPNPAGAAHERHKKVRTE